jgi:glycosyltransferase involved in cell wall biosynthesis
MFVYLYLDENDIVVKYTTNQIHTNRYNSIGVEVENPDQLVGQKYKQGSLYSGNKDKFKVAVIANFNDQCGIATYSKYLIDALIPKVDAVKIFAEKNNNDPISGYDIEYTWERGNSMLHTIKNIKDWEPSVVLIQHEFGLFPNARNFLPMLQALYSVPYAITLHSVYEHRDKSVCTSHIKNIIVHSSSGKKCLEDLGNRNNIEVIPHGCLDFGEVKQNWNIIGTPYNIVQFGFGFEYKGVDVALKAIKHLIDTDEKFKTICYTYYCSENDHSPNIFSKYYNELIRQVHEMGLENNVSIQRGYLSNQQLYEILRTYKMAIFPYLTDPGNVVYGSSGAAKVAMANNIPTVVSSSNMFDDLEGVLDRPSNYIELASSIDNIFSNNKNKESLLHKQREYIINNTWDKSADRYLTFLKTLK